MTYKAKNAPSLANPFSLGEISAKIVKIWIGQGEKCNFFVKMLVEWKKVCNFVVEKS